MNIDIRPARLEDAAQLIELNKAFDEGSDNITDDIGTVQSMLINNPTERIFVAELNNGSLAGFATLQLTHSFCYTRPTAELTGIFVSPAYRRQGLASGLIQAVKRHCEAIDSLELFLRVNRNNPNAIQCYQENGLSEANHYEYQIKYY